MPRETFLHGAHGAFRGVVRSLPGASQYPGQWVRAGTTPSDTPRDLCKAACPNIHSMHACSVQHSCRTRRSELALWIRESSATPFFSLALSFIREQMHIVCIRRYTLNNVAFTPSSPSCSVQRADNDDEKTSESPDEPMSSHPVRYCRRIASIALWP